MHHIKNLYNLILMKTIFTCFFIALGWFAGSHLHAQKKAYVPMASQPPVIDGIRESIWDESAFHTFQILPYDGIVNNPADLTANWSALWDTNHIYFLAQITDDILKNGGAGADKFWIHDCLEIFFDMLNEKNEVNTGDSPTDEKYQYRFIYGLDNEPIWEQPPVAGMENVSMATADGYLIEVKLPWTTLIDSHPFGDVIIGRALGAEFKVGDLDNNPQTWMPDGSILWNNPGIGSDDAIGLKRASSFGTLILVKDNSPDTIAPAAVTDLTASSVLAIEAQLEWTSVGDDTITGLAETYQIRFSTDSITSENWQNATLMNTSLVPQIAGTVQNITVPGLQADTRYFFAIKTGDEAGNLSKLSNIAEVTTPLRDSIAPSPVTDLECTVTRVGSIEIAWTAPGDDNQEGKALYYEIRYQSSAITAMNWDQAWLLNNPPDPMTAGTKQSANIIKLQPATPYYFAIKTTDEQNNTSALSNIAADTTLEADITRQTPMDQFIGTNAFIDDPLDKMKAAGFIREYHTWDWDAGGTAFPNNKIALNPSYAGGGWNFDGYYEKLQEAGITVSPCIMNSTNWLAEPGDTYPYEAKPVSSGMDTEDPGSYKAHADHMFQYAARYGSQVVDDHLLKLAANQTRVSGLGYLQYLENWNEPDRWWGSADDHFSPEEYAAMGSADRDGHEGSMGFIYGIKNADPEIKLVMAGLSEADTNYIEGIRQWCLKNRTDKKFVYDVINIHRYTLSNSPEQGNLKGMVQAIVDYRDQYLPDVEVWITEFGWDSGIPNTPFSCPSIGSYGKEEVQAQWIARSYLLLSSTGINRAAQFMLRNVKNDGTTQFDNCGLVNEKNDWTPKISWYYTYTLKNLLKGKYFAGEQSSGNPNVMIYKYENATHDTVVYAVWAPTSNGTIVENYKLNLSAPVYAGWITELTEDSIRGTTSDLAVVGNKVSIQVTEKPVFVFTSKTPVTTISETSVGSSLEVFPNPVLDRLTLGLSPDLPAGIYIVRIHSPAGQVLLQEQFVMVPGQTKWHTDLSGLAEGYYIIQVTAPGHLMNQKFIKSK